MREIICFIVITSAAYLIEAKTLKFTQFRTRLGFRSRNVTLEVIRVRSLIECAGTCFSKARCFGFNHGYGKCELLRTPNGEVQNHGWAFGYPAKGMEPVFPSR